MKISLEFRVLSFYIILFLIFSSSCNWNNQTYLPKDNSDSYSKEGSINSSKFSKNIKSKTTIKSYDGRDVVTGGIIDKDGKFWFSTSRNGIYCYDGKRFTNFTEDDGLCNNEVYSILEDKMGFYGLEHQMDYVLMMVRILPIFLFLPMSIKDQKLFLDYFKIKKKTFGWAHGEMGHINMMAKISKAF